MQTFGARCEEFDLPEDSDWAAELIKEGFTLEFMKNAIIRQAPPRLHVHRKPK
jgi:hypothetical protein